MKTHINLRLFTVAFQSFLFRCYSTKIVLLKYSAFFKTEFPVLTN